MNSKLLCQCPPTFWFSSFPSFRAWILPFPIHHIRHNFAFGQGHQPANKQSKCLQPQGEMRFLKWFFKHRYARTLGPKVLSFFEGYFNISFPLPKLDMFAIPDFAVSFKTVLKSSESLAKSILCIQVSAMENWGLITYR